MYLKTSQTGDDDEEECDEEETVGTSPGRRSVVHDKTSIIS
jgi:hypothetical protein